MVLFEVSGEGCLSMALEGEPANVVFAVAGAAGARIPWIGLGCAFVLVGRSRAVSVTFD